MLLLYLLMHLLNLLQIQSPDVYKRYLILQVLAQFQRIVPEDLAKAIGTMAQSSKAFESTEKGSLDLVIFPNRYLYIWTPSKIRTQLLGKDP